MCALDIYGLTLLYVGMVFINNSFLRMCVLWL